MYICFHFITGTPCSHETPRQGVRWINQSVRNPTCLMQLNRTCHFAGAVHACKSRPSAFRPSTTSDVLINMCMLRPYRPAYIVGMLDRHCMEYDFCVCHLYIAKNTSTILGPLLQKATEFTIGSFEFRFISHGTFERYADFSAYYISYEGVTLTFHLVLVDTMDCGPRACINFVYFIWENIKTFAFIKYVIVCDPLDTPKILFLRHYRSASDGWRKYNLFADCCRDCTPSVRQFVNNCTFPNSYSNYQNSCKCLRQPPTLRNLTSHSVFHHTFNLSVPTYRSNVVSPIRSRGILTSRSRS
jgi:hypothetical protein